MIKPFSFRSKSLPPFLCMQAGFDMEDFDEAEEMNEEDLISLGDEFAKIDLVNHVKN